MKGGDVWAAAIEVVDASVVGDVNWDAGSARAPWAAAVTHDGDGPMSCARLTGWGRRDVGTVGSAMHRAGATEGTEGHRQTLFVRESESSAKDAHTNSTTRLQCTSTESEWGLVVRFVVRNGTRFLVMMTKNIKCGGVVLLRRSCVGVFMCVWRLAMSAPLPLFLSFFLCPQKKSQKAKREGSTKKVCTGLTQTQYADCRILLHCTTCTRVPKSFIFLFPKKMHACHTQQQHARCIHLLTETFLSVLAELPASPVAFRTTSLSPARHVVLTVCDVFPGVGGFRCCQISVSKNIPW